jgi:hypothetical protein
VGVVGQPERATQDRVVKLFRDELGYRYLGEWRHRDGNSNVEGSLLNAYLTDGRDPGGGRRQHRDRSPVHLRHKSSRSSSPTPLSMRRCRRYWMRSSWPARPGRSSTRSISRRSPSSRQSSRPAGQTAPRAHSRPPKRALYGLLDQNEVLALKVHAAIINNRPDGWRGVHTKEQVVKRAMHEALLAASAPPDPQGAAAEVNRLFPTITAQREY